MGGGAGEGWAAAGLGAVAQVRGGRRRKVLGGRHTGLGRGGLTIMCVGPFGFPMRFLERGVQVSNPKFEIVAALQGRFKTGNTGKLAPRVPFCPVAVTSLIWLRGLLLRLGDEYFWQSAWSRAVQVRSEQKRTNKEDVLFRVVFLLRMRTGCEPTAPQIKHTLTCDHVTCHTALFAKDQFDFLARS